jgi:hypothetical protein
MELHHSPLYAPAKLIPLFIDAAWVPAMDAGQQFARIAIKTMSDPGFDHRANRGAKVRNVSRLGSQFEFLDLTLSD